MESLKDPKITVSVPVRIGGYTGQREEWEEHLEDYAVTLQGEDLVLAYRGTPNTNITIPWNTLLKTVELVGGSTR